MRQQRPAGIQVIAILLLLFGSLGALGGVCGLGLQLAGGAKIFVVTPAPGAPAPPDTEGMMRARIPYYDAMQYGGAALGAIVGGVMIASGIGLLKMRPWARVLAIIYACYNVVATIGSFVFNIAVVLPVMREVFAEVGADPKLPPLAAQIFNMTMAFTTAMMYAMLLFLVWPAAILIVMFHPRVRAAFQPKPREFIPEEDDAEEAVEGETETPREDGIKPGD